MIRSATVDAARVLRMEGRIGTIAPGDLIALDGNPLDNLDLLTGQGAHMPLIVQGSMVRKRSMV